MKSAFASLTLALLVGCQSTAATTETTAPVETATELPTNLVELLTLARFDPELNLTFDEGTARLLESIPVKTIGPASLNLLQVGEEKPSTPRPEPEFVVIPLEHAIAPDLARTLSRLTGAGKRGARKHVEILSDERTNSLLVMAEPDSIPPLKELVAILDIELED